MLRQTVSGRIPFVCTLSLLVVLASGGMALGVPGLATVQVHVSTDNYYANGTGVSVSYDIFGATDFTVGDTTGPILWEVTEKAWWDQAANQTIISYTLYNDSFPVDVTSLHVPVPAGVVALSVSAPAGWTGAQVGNEIVWQTPGPGIPQFESLDTMIVRYPGLHAITFLPNVKVDLANEVVLTNPNWVVTSIPEPATLALLTLGTLALKRRR